MRKLAPYLSFLRDVAFGVALWFLLTTFVGEVRIVPTPSMVPTIEMGDRIWTDKLILRFRPIRRGDIVVFNPPFPTDSPYVKRVIGLPGETLEVKSGAVYINGQPLVEPYIAQKPIYMWGPITVPAGQYIVLGDNRNDSYDSHQWATGGLLDRKAIIACAVFRIWPLDRIGTVR